MPIRTYINEDQIKNKINKIASQINCDYAEKDIFVIGILNGSFMFISDLVRKITIPMNIEFISAQSYTNQTVSSGNVKLNISLKENIEK